MDIKYNLVSLNNLIFLFRGFVFNKAEKTEKILNSFSSINQSELYIRLENHQYGDADKWVWRGLKGRDHEVLKEAKITAENEIHPDLYPIVKRVLVGNTESDGLTNGESRFLGLPPLILDSWVQERHFLIPLEDAAIRRLKDHAPEYALARHIPFKLEDAKVYLIGTGIGVLVWGIRFVNPFQNSKNSTVPVEVINEGTTILCRAYEGRANLLSVKLEYRTVSEDMVAGQAVGLDARYQLSRVTPNTTIPPQGLMLTNCTQGQKGLAALPHPLGSHPLRKWMDATLPTDWTGDLSKATTGNRSHERIFSYAAVQLPKTVSTEEAARVSYRLAHKYTSDYELSDEALSDSSVKPFKNIIHTMATQGGAVVVTENGTEFINQFVSFAVKTTYLPLALLAYHEYLFLRGLNETDLQPKRFSDYDEELEKNIIQFQKEIMEFRLHYRFCHVSDLNNQNKVFAQWRKTLKLDQMLAELSEDAAESERVLNTLREQRQKKDRILFGWVSVFAIFVLFSEVAELFTHLFVLPPVKIAPLIEKLSELLHKDSNSPEYKQAVADLHSQLKPVIEDMHSVHHWELGFFVVASLLFLYSLRFLSKHQKSPVGGE